MITDILNLITQQKSLSQQQSFDTMRSLMEGQFSDPQIAGLLVGLLMKGETIDEISGFVEALQSKAIKIKAPANTIDTCGTGGDKSGTFNISTASAIVAAAAGATVAKHGNRSVSSKCGSADVLAQLGVKVDLTPAQAEKCLNKIGITFLFAPLYHSSMKYAAPPRKALGLRTVFNILGPMANPAGIKRQMIGAFNLETANKMIHVLKNIKSEHVLVVHSKDGLDEISLSAPTTIFELKNNEISEYTISPKNFGIKSASLDQLKGNTSEENSVIIQNIFNGEKGPQSDVVALNAGAALYVSGLVNSIQHGVEKATIAIEKGNAKSKLDELIDFTNRAA
jgi:anthranilate phosphoribosyltransferase